MDLSNLSEEQLRKTFKSFNRFMMLLWRLGLGSWGNGTKYGGYVMVIKHTGRVTGLTRYTPVNYAIVDGDVFCTAGFGRISDWYRNITVNPQVEIWLPHERWAGVAEDVSEEAGGARYLREVIIASGFAGPLFGVDPRKLSDDDFERLLGSYRLIRIKRTEALTGRGGPGDLAWVWPLATMALTVLLLRYRKSRRDAV
jgi:deazaflavin-dependent oxidoreductase (nitroreductase family)